jgi:hypothetical protein
VFETEPAFLMREVAKIKFSIASVTEGLDLRWFLDFSPLNMAIAIKKSHDVFLYMIPITTHYHP